MSDKVSEDPSAGKIALGVAVLDWQEAREAHSDQYWSVIQLAASVAGAIAPSYPINANMAVAAAALDISERVMTEGLKRHDLRMKAWDAANPEPVEEPGDE